LANFSAMPRPNPLEAPVITITRFFNFFMMNSQRENCMNLQMDGKRAGEDVMTWVIRAQRKRTERFSESTVKRAKPGVQGRPLTRFVKGEVGLRAPAGPGASPTWQEPILSGLQRSEQKNEGGRQAASRSKISDRDYSARTFSACQPFLPLVTVNSTAWPSSRLRYPLLWMAEKCTKTSSPL